MPFPGFAVAAKIAAWVFSWFTASETRKGVGMFAACLIGAIVTVGAAGIYTSIVKSGARSSGIDEGRKQERHASFVRARAQEAKLKAAYEKRFNDAVREYKRQSESDSKRADEAETLKLAALKMLSEYEAEQSAKAPKLRKVKPKTNEPIVWPAHVLKGLK